MGRVAEAFDRCRKEGRSAFVPFLAAGDPDLATTVSALKILDRAGADVIEVGIPFSDPIADGPIIQASYQRALAGGVSLAQILRALRRVRLGTPLLLFTYLNPILQLGVRWSRAESRRLQDGLERVARQMIASGFGGVLICDLTPEEAGRYRDAFASQGMDTIFLAAPTTTEARMRKILPCCSGFLYLISRTGVTGRRTILGASVRRQIRRIRKTSSIPVAIGFGMRTPSDVRRGAAVADGVVVGSAIVEKLNQLQRRRGWEKKFHRYVAGLANATRHSRSR